LNINAVSSHFHAPRCCEKILFYPKDYLIYFYSLSVFLFFRSPTCYHAGRRARRKTFRREESERLLENNNKQTSTPSKHLLSAKKTYFNVLSVFLHKKIKPDQNTCMFFSPLFCFFPMNQFFIASKKFENRSGSV